MEQNRFETLRRWSDLLDRAFRVPGTRLRFGWDALIGLIPGLGDLVPALFSCWVLIEAFRVRIPKIIQLRMFFNILVDLFAGYIPLAGDLFDLLWQSNSKNMQLLERYAFQDKKAEAADWIFVGFMLALVFVFIVLPLIALLLFLQDVGLF